MSHPPLRFGYGFDFRNPKQWFKPWHQFYSDLIDFIVWTESKGFEGVWLAEHHGIEDGYLPSPLTVGTWIAARTEKMRIDTGVALAPFYHPVRLAEDLAVLDILSNGRAGISLGLGYLQFEADAYGFDLSRRGKIADELLEIVVRLWEGETVTFEGEFFNVKKARIFPLPLQKPHIPIFVGGTTKKGFRRAARFADGFNGPVEYWPEYVNEVKALGKPESAARIQSLSYSDMWMVVWDDKEEALNEIAPHAHYQINGYAEWQQGEDWAPFEQQSLEDFKKTDPNLKVFTPGQAIDYIRSRQELAPIESFCMQVPAGCSPEKYRKYAQKFAEEVIPAFR